jgi:hypothetical protein
VSLKVCVALLFAQIFYFPRYLKVKNLQIASDEIASVYIFEIHLSSDFLSIGCEIRATFKPARLELQLEELAR